MSGRFRRRRSRLAMEPMRARALTERGTANLRYATDTIERIEDPAGD